MLSSFMKAQGDPDSIQKKLSCHLSSLQKVFMHINKKEFVSGENIYFKAYLVKALGNIPDKECKVLYIELRNYRNQKIVSSRINLENGTCNSAISLPDTLSTGIYVIRAFSNEMRNYDHALYFRENLTIINQADEMFNKVYVQEKIKTQLSLNSCSEPFVTLVKETEERVKIFFHPDSLLNQVPQYLLIHNGKSILCSSRNVRKEKDRSFSLDITNSHILYFVILDPDYNEIAENTYLINNSEAKLEMDKIKKTYKTSEEVTINLIPKNLKDNLLRVSVSISKIINSTSSCTIEKYLNWHSNFTAAYNIKDSSYQLGKYIQIQGNTYYYNWKNLMHNMNRTCVAIPENKGYVVSGKVYNANYVPVENACVYMSVADTFSKLKYCITNSSGTFYFRVPSWFDNKNLIFQVRDEYRKNLKIELEDKYNDELQKGYSYMVIDPEIKSSMETMKNSSLTDKLLNIKTFKEKNSNEVAIDKDLYNFFGSPDEIVYPKDYSELNDFEEIVRNILMGVHYRKIGASFSLRVMDRGTQNYWPFDALILLNNVPFPDLNYIANLNSKQIKSIEIKKNHIVYGGLDFYGIVSIKTYQTDVYAFDIDNSCTLLPNTVLNASYTSLDTFYDNNLPDLRHTLYWNPDLNLANDTVTKVHFKTSEIEGYYSIDVEGITDGGIPVSYQKIFKVEK